jgi:predicted phage terminase large subunit-like protein
MQAMRNAHKWVHDRWPRVPYNTLVEKAANGAEIVGSLKRELSGVIAITVSKDKVTRALAAQPALEAGNIYLPGRAAPDTAAGYHAADWVANLIEEAATFPNGRHDDQVDAFSQAINWAQTKTSTTQVGSGVPTGEIPIDPYSYGLTAPIGHTSIHPYDY